MKFLSKPRFWVAFAAAIGALFYANVLGIGDVRVRSVVAGAVAGWLCIAWECWSAPSPIVPSRAIALSVTAAVYSLVFFGDLFGVANPFLRVPLAVTAGSLAGFVVEALVEKVAYRHGLSLLAAMGLSVACGAAAPNPDAAWSAGFASAIGHFCPAWQTDAVEIAREGGSPDIEHYDAWAPGTPAASGFHAGGVAGQAAFKADPGFCSHPTASPPARPLVARFVAAKGSFASRSGTTPATAATGGRP